MMNGMDDFHNSGSGITQENVHNDGPGPDPAPGFLLPRYLIYLSLGFKWIVTPLILLMAGWVLITIKTTRRLHKPHNIFVANLMITSTIISLVATLQSSIMVIGYISGVGDFIACNVYQFLTLPSAEFYYTFLMISVDKLIAIVYPYKHRKIMTPRIAGYTIVASWILAIALSTPRLFNPGDYTKVAEYSMCLSSGSSLLEALLLFTLPTLTSSLLAVTIDVYLAITAYRVSKQIKKETTLSGASSNEVKTLNQKKATIKKHLKPMMTLLIAVLGSTSTCILFAALYYSTRAMSTATVYKQLIELVFSTNVGYIIFLLQPFIYGLYYKQTREPMMKLLNRMFINCSLMQQS